MGKDIDSKMRMQFVEKWAKFVVENDSWSKLQSELIDSQLENARKIKLSKEQVKKIKQFK
ncbi:MAG: hypothetical protein QXD13_02315 [Candidatus Pacearchaeota archaeon]